MVWYFEEAVCCFGSFVTMMMAIMFLPNYDTLKRAVWYFEEGVDTLKRVV